MQRLPSGAAPELLKRLGVSKLSELGQDQYAAAIKLFTEAESEEEPSRRPLTAAEAVQRGEERRKRATKAMKSFGLAAAGVFGEGFDVLEPLIPGIVWPGEPMVIAGPAKTFKSNVAAELAVSLAYGSRAFGSIEAPKSCRRVAMFSGEFYHAPDLRACVEKIRSVREVNDNGNLLLSRQVPNLQNETDLERLVDLIYDERIDFVIIDPIYDQAERMTEAEQAGLGANIRYICEQTGAAVAVVCHTTRRNDRKPGALPSLSDVKGPIFEKLARGWLLVNEAKRYQLGAGKATLNLVTGHHSGHSGRYTLEIDQGGSPPSQWITTLTDKSAEQASTGAKQEAKPKAPSPAFIEKILATLEGCDGLTQSAIARGVNRSSKDVGRALDYMAADGQIETAEGPDGQTCYRLPRTFAESDPGTRADALGRSA